MQLTASQLKAIMPRCNTAQWLDPLNAAIARFEIDSPTRMAAFLAQVALESAETTSCIENLNYTTANLCAVRGTHR